MVKPASEGSSIGMSKVRSAARLDEAYALAVNYDRVVIAEKFIDGTELTAGILGDQVLPLIKLETPREFYDYEASTSPATRATSCPAACPRRASVTAGAVPEGIPRARLQRLGARRSDAQRQGRPFLLEVNTVPGMTTIRWCDGGARPWACRTRTCA